jgi:hypothetical protein
MANRDAVFGDYVPCPDDAFERKVSGGSNAEGTLSMYEMYTAGSSLLSRLRRWAVGQHTISIWGRSVCTNSVLSEQLICKTIPPCDS